MAQESKTAQSSNASKLERAMSILKSRLEDEGTVLDTLVAEAARGRSQPDLWKMLHEAAVRDDMLPELAFAYEQMARGKRLKAAAPAVQAEVLMHAVSFFVEVFGDADGAAEVLERVLAAVPGHPEAFAHLERLLIAAQNWLALADLYMKTAEHRTDMREQVALLRRAAELVDRMPGEVERAIQIYERILQVDPSQRRFRRTLEARYLLAGRTQDAANFLEQVLGGQPPPDEDEAFAMRTRLMVLYAGELGEVLHALPHVEELLRRDPAHEQARLVAQRLLEHEESASRAAAVLAEVYERLGSAPEAAAMLAIQLEHEKGRERSEVQRRLAILRQDGLGDPSGAQPLLEALVLADPGDDEIRMRFRAVSAALDRRLDAARTLARAAGVTKDLGLRARIGAELGEVLVEAGDVKRARAVYQEVIDRGGDDRAVLAAARELTTLYGLARESKSLALVLELLTRVETDSGARLAAAEKLARLLETELGDTQGAIAAWRSLIGTELEERALGALEALYDKVGAREELADVLDRRAQSSAGPAARVLAFRAAEMRATARPGDALETWRTLLAAHGPARDVHARLIPLLEQDKRWDELAAVIAQEAPLAPPAERAPLTAKLAELRQQLGDGAGAVDAHREVLRLDSKNVQSRKALEAMLVQGEHRLAAAEVLEPIFRAEGSPAELCRALEAKAELCAEVGPRLLAYEQAVVLLERDLEDPKRALEMAASALREAAQSEPKKVTAWLERVEKLAHAQQRAGALEPRHRAAMLVQALGDRDVDARPLARLARSAADALESVGDIDRALILYRRVQSFEPSPDLEKRIKKLVLEQKSPDERLASHQVALEQAADAARRRELLHSIAAVHQDELSDIPAAISSWQRALEDDAHDAVALEGLAKCYAQAGDDEARFDAQRRLAIVRQDLLRDGGGALALLEKLVLAHPEDTELRRRLRAAAAAQNRRSDAVRALSQAQAAASDAALKAQLGCELGETLVEAGDTKRARVVLQDVVDRGGDDAAVLVAARALALLFARARESKPLSAVLERLSRLEPEQVERWAAVERLVKLAGDRPSAISAWQAFATHNGPSREIYARLVPLLEQESRWKELADVLAADAELAPENDRAAVLALLAELYVSRLGDAPAAFVAWRKALALDPDDKTSRRALEQMLGDGEHRAAAAEVLEPIVRAEGDSGDLVRVLVTRGEAAPDPALRLAAFDEAVGILERDLSAPEHALDLATRALKQALSIEAQSVDRLPAGKRAPVRSGPAAPWLDRVERLAGSTDPARRAAVLGEVLGERPIDSPTAARLARLTGEAFEAAGDLKRALGLYHRALATHASSTELKVRVYSLMMKKAEETLGNRAAAVAHVSKHVLAVSPDQMDAAFAIALLLPEVDGLEGTLAALRDLEKRSEGAVRTALELIGAELLLDRLHRPDEALEVIDRVLTKDPNDPASLPILERALARPASRERAIAMLQRASDAADDPARAVAIVERLIAAPPLDAEPEGARRAWFDALIDRYAARPEVALGVSVRAVAELPDEDSLWDRAERLARVLNRPEPVLETFKGLLDSQLDPATLSRVGRRAVEFHEEWFEDEDGAILLLKKMLPIDPPWAFDRLKLSFSASGRWSDLFTLYDDSITAATDDSQREKLLEEAAQVAKDFANDADRAIVYLERLAQVRHADGRIDAALERLYERKGKSRELIDLLSARLPQMSGDEAQQMRVRIAALWLDSGDELEAFQRIEQMLEAEPNRAEAFQLLERIVLAPGPLADINAPTEEIPSAKRRLPLRELQRGAALLKDRYTAEGRTQDLVRVVTVELETETADDGRIKRHRELAELKRALGNDAGAFEDVASLVALETRVPEHRQQLAELADRLGLHQRLADVLVSSAERSETAAAGWDTGETRGLSASLMREAAVVHRERLANAPRAIELFMRVIDLAQDDPAMVLAAAREVEPLLEAARRDQERCSALETIALLEKDPAARRAAFGQVARLAAEVLGDEARAVNAWRARLLDDAGDREALDGLAQVLHKAKRWRELIDVLDRRATVTTEADPARAKADRVTIARIYLDELSSVDDGIDAWKAVRSAFGPDEENFTALAGLLEAQQRWQDLATLLAEEAAASRDVERKVALHRRLGDLHREKIGDLSSAAQSYRDALALDPRDAASRAGVLALLDTNDVRPTVIDALARAHVETGDWERASELAGALGSGEDVPSTVARKFWWGVALYYRDDKGDADAAEWALRRSLSHDESNAEILTSLAAVQRRAPGRPLVDTLVRLSDVRGGDLDLLREAAEVGIRTLGDRDVGSQNCEKLLDLAVSRWTATGRKEGGKKKRLSDVADDPRSPRAIANWALDELTRMATENDDHARVVSLLLRGSELPFEKNHTRRLRREAARISADRLGDAEGAIRIYRNLFDEDPADEIAAQEVDRFAALLDASGLNADVVALWEERAKSRAAAGDTAGAAELFARAADLAEQRLADVDRAIADHRQGAELGGGSSLEALARIHTARGEHQAASEAMEALCRTASAQVLPPATLRLADSYVAAGDRATARKRLEEAAEKLEGAPDDPARPVRARLAAIYREDQAWDPLADLFTAEAQRSKGAEKLGYLRDASTLHLFMRRDPTSSIPLLEQALSLAPDEAVLALTLSETLCTVGRPADAMKVMTAQIERYGSRKPKDRAVSHYALARAAQAAGDRTRALAELDAGAKIDSTHAGILHALGRLATSEGQLDRAVRAYQALLLVRRPQEDTAAQQAYEKLVDLGRAPGEGREGDLTRAELLLELSRIVKRQGDNVRADEFMESAREAARENPASAERFERALARG